MPVVPEIITNQMTSDGILRTWKRVGKDIIMETRRVELTEARRAELLALEERVAKADEKIEKEVDARYESIKAIQMLRQKSGTGRQLNCDSY